MFDNASFNNESKSKVLEYLLDNGKKDNGRVGNDGNEICKNVFEYGSYK